MCEEMCISQINIYIYILEGQGVGIIVYDKNKKKQHQKDGAKRGRMGGLLA